MKTLVILIVFSLGLMGCSASNENTSGNYKMPPEMADCKVYRLVGDGVSKTLYVVRCPNSTTSTNWNEQQGKTNHSYSVTYTDQ